MSIESPREWLYSPYPGVAQRGYEYYRGPQQGSHTTYNEPSCFLPLALMHNSSVELPRGKESTVTPCVTQYS